MCTVRDLPQYECPPIGIVNGVKVLRNRKKVFDVVLEELYVFVKVVPTLKLI